MEQLPDDDQFISDFGATLGEVRAKMRRLEDARSLRLDTVGMTVAELEEAEVERQELARAEAKLLQLRDAAAVQPASGPTVKMAGATPLAAKRSDLPLWAKWTLPILALVAAITFGVLKLLFP